MFRALAFIPPDLVPSTFMEIKARIPKEFDPLIGYMEKNFILGNTKAKKGPRFQIALWNLNERFLNNEMLTTNIVESWHRRINVIVGANSVNVNLLLIHLQRESLKISNDICNIESGRSIEHRSSQISSNKEHVRIILENGDKYENNFKFIKAIAKNI